jgi:hypothetical protein
MAVSRSISVMNDFLKTEARRDCGRLAGVARRVCIRIFGTDKSDGKHRNAAGITNRRRKLSCTVRDWIDKHKSTHTHATDRRAISPYLARTCRSVWSFTRGNEKTPCVSADHHQNSSYKVAPTNHKESYQLQRFDNCERNRQDQEGLIRTKPPEETVNGARNSHCLTLLLTITPLQQDRSLSSRMPRTIPPEPTCRRVRSFFSKQKIRRITVPTWRADYFERANGHTPERSVIIAAEDEAIAFEEVRAGMGPTCSRAEVTKLDSDSVPGSQNLRFSISR